tara:strand:- start:318 stop:596 length:279 start_codon:yes stop_codon:yes gene_type:complete
MEKRLDSRQYVADLEKHIDAMSDELAKFRKLKPDQYEKSLEKQVDVLNIELEKVKHLLEKSLVFCPPNHVSNIKDEIESYLYGANRNYVDQD